MARARKQPWKRPRPQQARHTTLTASAKRTARRRARTTGRRYPNLVDNMRAATRRRKKKTTKRRRG